MITKGMIDDFKTLPQSVKSKIIEYATKKDISSYYLGDKKLSDLEIERINEVVKRMNSGEFLQHILGYEYFYGRKFIVSKDTLIPRPETEGLVEEVLKFNPKRVLDIGTGTGCIAVTISKEAAAQVDAIDISSSALKIAKENNKNNESNVRFIEVDVRNHKGRYDLVVSNPPYIETEVLKGLEVYRHEPRLALDGGEDGLEVYRIIFEKIDKLLEKKGVLALEIGYNQREAILELSRDKKFSSRMVKKDLLGRDRYFIAVR